MRFGAQIRSTVLNGRLGQSPLRLAAGGGRIVGKEFNFNGLAMRLGRPDSPIVFDAAKVAGTFSGKGLSGTFGGGTLDDRQYRAANERHRRALALL